MAQRVLIHVRPVSPKSEMNLLLFAYTGIFQELLNNLLINFYIVRIIPSKRMDTKSKQAQEAYDEADLRAMKAEESRKIASTFKISKIKSYKKDQLIKAILKTQNISTQNVQLPQQVEREDSDLKSLVLNERFDGKIQTYQYIPNNESLKELVELLYPKLIHVANKHTSYKISIDVKATFESPKYDMIHFIFSPNATPNLKLTNKKAFSKIYRTELTPRILKEVDGKFLQLTKCS